jgi:dynactin complex subunit
MSRSPRSSTSTGSNIRRLHGEIGYLPPAEFEEVIYASKTEEEIKGLKVSTEPRASVPQPTAKWAINDEGLACRYRYVWGRL